MISGMLALMTQRSNPNMQTWYLYSYSEEEDEFNYVADAGDVERLPDQARSQTVSKQKVLEQLATRPPRAIKTAFRPKEGAPFKVGASVRRVKGKGGVYYLRTDADHLKPNNLGELEDAFCAEDFLQGVLEKYSYDRSKPDSDDAND